ncbi:MAG: DUF4381 family protein [Cocleimonas sp.]|nr:DUF4381 family protein [Cocleimonas sp.]
MSDEKTSVEKLASGQLEGLILPAPPEVFYWWFWIIAGLLLAMLAFVWFKKCNSPKAKARRELKHLQSKITDEKQAKNIATDIAVSLRHGLNLTRLDEYMPDSIPWHDYLGELDNAIYADKHPSQVDLLSLILKAQSWLNKADV